MNGSLKKGTPRRVKANGQKIELMWMGTVPGFKNNKIIVQIPIKGTMKKRPMMITKPEYRKIMDSMTRSFKSQLASTSQTTGVGI